MNSIKLIYPIYLGYLGIESVDGWSKSIFLACFGPISIKINVCLIMYHERSERNKERKFSVYSKAYKIRCTPPLDPLMSNVFKCVSHTRYMWYNNQVLTLCMISYETDFVLDIFFIFIISSLTCLKHASIGLGKRFKI